MDGRRKKPPGRYIVKDAVWLHDGSGKIDPYMMVLYSLIYENVRHYRSPDDTEKRRSIILSAVDRLGIEKIKDDLSGIFREKNARDWISMLHCVRRKKYWRDYLPNISRGIVLRMYEFPESPEPETEFIKSAEYAMERRRILTAIKRCRTGEDLVELFKSDPRTPMVMRFLNHWVRSV